MSVFLRSSSLKGLFLGICLTSTIVGIILMVNLEYNHGSEYWRQELILHTKYLVNTNACKIPRTPIWPEFVKKDWKIRKNSDCSKKKALAQLNDSDQMLRIFPEYSNYSCCLTEIHLVHKIDSNKVKQSKCTEIVENIVDVSQMEILAVKCGDHVNYEANIPIKSSVEKKIKKWKSTKPDDLPLNLVVIGIDTVSRSHAYRSIPRTMDLLKQMGFKDFLGFHSVAASSLPNFMAFLMGLEGKAMREGCAPNWKFPLDSCPLIWKDFSQNDYVTMQMEDGIGTLEWGGKSGFQSPPTDYYLYPIFIASHFKPCTSTETVPQFQIRYTRRFIQKFERTPFFSFTWLNFPFHDDPHTLSNLENDTFQFFDSLQSIPGLLKRTVVVFLSDHGDRYSKFSHSGSIEAYIERGLPLLFIRFPEILKKRHPELEFEHNINFMTTPFDLHQTFLHILALDGFNVTTTPLDSRQSLLTRIESDANRTCDTLHVLDGSCVCNVNVDNETDQVLNNLYLKKQIVRILKRKLNGIVKSSKYRNICAKWVIREYWISSMQIIRKTTNDSDLHVQFSADSRAYENPRGIASFEAKIRIDHRTLDKTTGSKEFLGSKLIGRISRVNRYGNQSWCVGLETRVDKEMKKYCLCDATPLISKKRKTKKRKREKKQKFIKRN